MAPWPQNSIGGRLPGAGPAGGVDAPSQPGKGPSISVWRGGGFTRARFEAFAENGRIPPFARSRFFLSWQIPGSMTGRRLAALSFVVRGAPTSLVRNTHDPNPCRSRIHVTEKARPETAHRLVQIDVELAVDCRLERLSQIFDRSGIVARVDEIFRIAGVSVAGNDASKRTIERASDRICRTPGRHLVPSDR